MAEDMNNPEAPRRFGRRKFLIGGAVGLAGAGLAALGIRSRGGDGPPPVDLEATKSTQTPQIVTAPAPAETATPKAAVTSTPEVKPDAKSPPTTPEAKKEVPCQILSLEFCARGELIDYTDAQGKKWTDIGFRLPKDTPVYSPMTGQITRSQIPQPNDAAGFSVGIRNVEDPNTITYSLLGDLRFDTEKGTINEGEIVGHIAGTGAKSFGEYDLIVTARQGGTTASILKELFPQAFEKPAKKIISTQSAISSPATKGGANAIFSNNPPPPNFTSD